MITPDIPADTGFPQGGSSLTLKTLRRHRTASARLGNGALIKVPAMPVALTVGLSKYLTIDWHARVWNGMLDGWVKAGVAGEVYRHLG